MSKDNVWGHNLRKHRGNMFKEIFSKEKIKRNNVKEKIRNKIKETDTRKVFQEWF